MKRIRHPSVGLGDGRKGPQVKKGGQPLHIVKGQKTDFPLTRSPASTLVSVLQREQIQIHEQHCQTTGVCCL